MRTVVAAVLVASFVAVGFAPTSQAGNVNRRLERQSERISNGVNKHKMNANEQMASDNADYRIAAQEQAMRTKHHGKLTAADRRKLNRELNHNSRRIHADKH